MDQELTFRDAREEDLNQVARIHVAAWKSAYRGMIDDRLLDALETKHRLPLWKEWWTGPGVRLILALRGQELAGFLRLCPARDFLEPPAGFAEFTHVYLEPDRVGSGLGRRLFEYGITAIQAANYPGLLLWVLEENTRARKFYEGFGLHADGARASQPEHLGAGVYEIRYSIRWDNA